MKQSAFTSEGQHRPFIIPEKASYLQKFHTFATAVLADQRYTSIVDFLDCINRKANEIVNQATQEGISDAFELQMEIFDLARQYASRYSFP